MRSKLYDNVIALLPAFSGYNVRVLNVLSSQLKILSKNEAEEFYQCLSTIFKTGDLDCLRNDFSYVKLFGVIVFYIRNKDLAVRNIYDLNNKADSNNAFIGSSYPYYLLKYLFINGRRTPWVFIQLFFEMNDFELTFFKYYLKNHNIRYYKKLPLSISKKEENLFLHFPKKRIKYMNMGYLLIYILFVKVANILDNESLSDVFYRSALFSNTLVSDSVIENWSSWRKVFFFFKRNEQELDLNQLGPILDFLIDKMVYRKNMDGINFKQISVKRLLKYIEEWHIQIYLEDVKENANWKRTFRSDKKYKDKSEEYIFVEITDALELYNEGKALKHCVQTYISGCIKGSYSIWSLRRIISGNNYERLLTIQIKNNCIYQARGLRNRMYNCFEGRLLEAWAIDNNLVFGVLKPDDDLPF